MDELLNYLHNRGLLSDELKDAIVEFSIENPSSSRSDGSTPRASDLDNVYNEEDAGVMRFGKYKGKFIEDIASFDLKYLQWCAKQAWLLPDIKEEMLKYF
jgi:uncharacterized protein (DUF3820 family)